MSHTAAAPPTIASAATSQRMPLKIFPVRIAANSSFIFTPLVYVYFDWEGGDFTMILTAELIQIFKNRRIATRFQRNGPGSSLKEDGGSGALTSPCRRWKVKVYD